MMSTKELTLAGNRHLQLIFQFLSSFFQVIVTVKNRICCLDIVIDINTIKAAKRIIEMSSNGRTKI
jgi:hypothetical protein